MIANVPNRLVLLKDGLTSIIPAFTQPSPRLRLAQHYPLLKGLMLILIEVNDLFRPWQDLIDGKLKQLRVVVPEDACVHAWQA